MPRTRQERGHRDINRLAERDLEVRADDAEMLLVAEPIVVRCEADATRRPAADEVDVDSDVGAADRRRPEEGQLRELGLLIDTENAADVVAVGGRSGAAIGHECLVPVRRQDRLAEPGVVDLGLARMGC